MRAGGVPRNLFATRWSRGLLLLAGACAVGQFLFFGLLSPGSAGGHPGRPAARHAWVVAPEQAVRSDWFWLLHPGLLLLPSARGFSGRAWLNPTPHEFALESTAVRVAPLPFVPPTAASSWNGLVPRAEPGLAGRWAAPPLSIAVQASPLPFPAAAVVRVGAGLEGWTLTVAAPPVIPAGSTLARPTVVRVWLDSAGEVAAPPTIWESSGVAAADEAARDVVARARFSPGDGSTTAGSGTWGLVVVDWPVPAAPAPVATPPAGS